jgi:hypothetical protein
MSFQITLLFKHREPSRLDVVLAHLYQAPKLLLILAQGAQAGADDLIGRPIFAGLNAAFDEGAIFVAQMDIRHRDLLLFSFSALPRV